MIFYKSDLKRKKKSNSNIRTNTKKHAKTIKF